MRKPIKSSLCCKEAHTVIYPNNVELLDETWGERHFLLSKNDPSLNNL